MRVTHPKKVSGKNLADVHNFGVYSIFPFVQPFDRKRTLRGHWQGDTAWMDPLGHPTNDGVTALIGSMQPPNCDHPTPFATNDLVCSSISQRFTCSLCSVKNLKIFWSWIKMRKSEGIQTDEDRCSHHRQI